MILALLLSSLSLMPMPGAGEVPPEAVPFAVVEALAGRKAAAEWPGARLGVVLPYLDEEGRTVAWMFHFRTDGREFPDYETVHDDILRERDGLGPNADLTGRKSGYAFVLASARFDRPPVLAHGYGVSEYYAVGHSASVRARRLLGPGAELTRLYFDWPRVNLEFAAGGQRVILCSQSGRAWQSRAEYAAELAARRAEAAAQYGLDEAAIASAHRQAWADCLERDFTDFTEVFVPEHRRAPFYDWSYGCTPTSGAMVCGYHDRTREYGRLVRWFSARWEPVRELYTWQIPDAQRENAVAMRTDTSSGGTSIFWIGPGLQQVFENNGYSAEMVLDQGGSHNDWAWNTITSEIDGGYAMIWSALWEIHSLAAFGYRTPDKYVYVHNTWWQPAAWWYYSGPDWSHVASPHPSGSSPYSLQLTFPLGDTFYNSTGRGDVLQVGDTAHVTWNNGGNPATRVDIEISHNRGRSWVPLASGLPDNGSYAWYIAPETPAQDSVRLRLTQYQGSTLTSADGSFGDIRLIREPLPPLNLAPPNGRQLFEAGIVLLVDSLRSDIDSFEFRVLQSTDTVWRSKSAVPVCSLPDSLFIYGRSYKWFARGRNVFGWGGWGTPWTFWCRFNAGVAENSPSEAPAGLRVAAVGGRGTGVRFEIGPAAAGTRLVLYDALGTRVRELVPGPEVSWDGRDDAGRSVPAGLFFARLEREGQAATVRFLLMD
ncbi:MAG: hypothetical protein R6X12_10150 [bacterium]